MTQIEILAIVTPVFVGGVVIATVWIATYFDDRKAKAERQARAVSRNDNSSRAASAAE